MKCLANPVVTVLGVLATVVAGAKIMVINDDSWVSANIRATFDALKAIGHDVLLVAPVNQQSGHGGQTIFPTVNITAPGGEFGSVPVGAPFFGHDINDTRIWYFNGTPAATALFGIDIIAPMFFGNESLDLVVSGPNEGQNAGPALFTISGTQGATYTSVERGIPAIAFSAGNGTHRPFTDNTGLPSDPANLAAKVVVNFVTALINTTNTSTTSRLLPQGLGVNVNIPTFGPDSNCTDPPFILTRLTGGATIDKVSIDPTTGFPTTTDLVTPALNSAFSGALILPGENIVAAGCANSVSVYSIDYDAPSRIAQPLQLQLMPLFGKSSL